MGKANCCINRKKLTILGLNSLFVKLSSFLLKQSPHVNRLALYDENEASFPCDISNINTQCKVRAYIGQDQLGCAVKNADVVLIGDQDDITSLVPHHKRNLQKETGRLLEYSRAIAEHAPCAVILVATTPVNCLLPLVSEHLINCGVYDCNKVLGVTAVDNVRANKLAANFLNMDPRKVILPVIGGSSPDTRVPIFSQARPSLNLTKRQWLSMTWDIKNSETVIQRTRGQGESVNKAYATVRFIHSVLAGLRGEPNIAEIVLAKTILVPETPYFALPVILGPQGIQYRFNIPALTQSETLLVEHAAKCINRDVESGLKYLGNKYFSNDTVCDARGLVGTLMKKICNNGTKDDMCKKPEYLLMTNKQSMDLNPEFSPSEFPVALPYVENENCSNCNKGCTPLNLPVAPSTPRKTNRPPPCFNKEGKKVSTPFAPIVSKENDKSFIPPCDTLSNNCCELKSGTASDKIPNNYTILPPYDNNKDASKSVVEERIKVKAKKLMEEKQRDQIRRKTRKDQKFPNRKDDDCEKGDGQKGNDTMETLSKPNISDIGKESVAKKKRDPEQFGFDGDNWPKKYGEKREFFDLKTFKEKKVPNVKSQTKFVGSQHQREKPMDKEKLPNNFAPTKPVNTDSETETDQAKVKPFHSKMEPTSYILSKKRSLLNFDQKENSPESNSENYIKKFFSFMYFKGYLKPKGGDMIKDKVEMDSKELEEAYDMGHSRDGMKKPFQTIQSNPSLLALLKNMRSKGQKENECKGEPVELNTIVDTVNMKSSTNITLQKSNLHSIPKTPPPVFTEEHLKLCKQIDEMARLRAEKLSKVYAPKCPPHFLHGPYPESNKMGSMSQLNSFNRMNKHAPICLDKDRLPDQYTKKVIPFCQYGDKRLDSAKGTYTVVTQPSAEEIKSHYGNRFDTLAQIHSRDCKDCELCKLKKKKIRNPNYVYKETRCTQRDADANNK